MTVHFDHEKLDVYQLELQFLGWLTPLFEDIKGSGRPRLSEVCDQLDRASLSALLNTAEGNGKRQRPVRAKFFDDARGSTMECAACLDAIVAKGACNVDRVSEGKQALLRIASMLTRLVQLYSQDGQMKESESSYMADDSSPV